MTDKSIAATDVRDLAIKSALTAGRFIAERLTKPHQVEHKGVVNLVTESDKGSEKLITDLISKRFPDHRIMAEEGTQIGNNAEHLWVIDPLDGTTNYAHGYPNFSVSIAYLHHGETVLGVIYDPLRDELFTAQKGQGAFLGNQRLHVSNTSEVIKCLISTGFPYDRPGRLPKTVRNLAKLLEQVQNMRADGSAALDLCYVAMGRVDGFWENDLSPWDTAAGCLMVTEAGGKISSNAGDGYHPFTIYDREILASNGIVHDELMRITA
jgi:myo-inositol-1(or 4)-monophosphatase